MKKYTEEEINEMVNSVFSELPKKAVLVGYCKGDSTLKDYANIFINLCNDNGCTHCQNIKQLFQQKLQNENNIN